MTSLKRYTDEQFLEAYQNTTGTPNAIAKYLGCDPKTAYKRHKALFDSPVSKPERNDQLHIAPPPDEMPIEDILAYKEAIFDKLMEREKYSELIHVTVSEDKPIAIALLGDPHFDDDGCHVRQLRHDLNVIKDTEGMYAGHIGDLLNNWVGRLLRLHANQSTTAETAIRLMEWMLNYCPNLFVIFGNHDVWNQGRDILNLMLRHANSVNEPHGARIALNFPNGKQVRINARHDFKGFSQYNPTHGHRKEQLWQAHKDHIYVSGHRHVDAMSMIPQTDGTCSWSFIVSGYKVIDDYAKEGGFPKQKVSCSLTVIIDPTTDHPGELVKPFPDIEAAAKYLTFLRSQEPK